MPRHSSFALMVAFATVVAASSSFAADKPRIAPDESLTVAEYVQAGSPASGREWSGSDYELLAEVLARVAEKNPRSLPRFGSPRSGALMQRVVSEANFGTMRDRELSVGVRIGEAIAINQNLAAVIRPYLDATNGGESFDRELIELLSFGMKLNDELWKVTDEFVATLTAEQLKERAGALATMRSGTAQIVSGALTTLTETNVYRTSELRRFVASMTSTLPAMLRRVAPESVTETRVRLRSIAEKTTDPELQRAIRGLLAAVS